MRACARTFVRHQDHWQQGAMQTNDRFVNKVASSTIIVQVHVVMRKAFIDYASRILIASGSPENHIVPTYLGPVPNVVNKSLPGPEHLETHNTMNMITDIMPPNVLGTVGFELM